MRMVKVVYKIFTFGSSSRNRNGDFNWWCFLSQERNEYSCFSNIYFLGGFRFPLSCWKHNFHSKNNKGWF